MPRVWNIIVNAQYLWKYCSLLLTCISSVQKFECDNRGLSDLLKAVHNSYDVRELDNYVILRTLQRLYFWDNFSFSNWHKLSSYQTLCWQKVISSSQNELWHDKTNKMSVRPAKTQISLNIRPDWSESSLCTQWVAMDPRFLHADSEDSDQTGPTLPYPILPPTLPYPTIPTLLYSLPYPTLPLPLPYPTLPYPTLPYPILPYLTLPYPISTIPYPIPYPTLSPTLPWIELLTYQVCF